jgi:hypothetical protein
MQHLLLLKELETSPAAREMIRRMSEEIFPSTKPVADTTQRICSSDSRTPEQAGQPL